ncbi:MAG: ABC transporter permease [Nonlabens sp.]
MIKNYIKIAFRNLWKHKGYSALNIAGLAIGMSAGFLIILYLNFKNSYDDFHPNGDRTYRVVTDIKTPSDSFETPVVDWNQLNELEAEFPEIEYQTLIQGETADFKVGNENYREDFMAANENFFDIFGFELLQGNPASALKEPLSVVLTQETAQRYFPNENAVGKSIKFQSGQYTVTVTGIIENMPENTMLNGEMILSISSYFEVIDPEIKESWANFSNLGFVVLAPGTDPDAFESKIKEYNTRVHGDKMEGSGLTLTYYLEPIEDVHLYSNRGQSAQISNVYIFGIVALFIILIASINFINLTTARSVERAKEVGIRKVVGAQRNQLAFQFLSESIVVCMIAFLLSVGITMAALPYFNQMAGHVVADGILSNPQYIMGLFILSILIALTAGIYPALVLSSFAPIKVLKGVFSTSTSGGLLRKGLVISQFTISLVMIISTIIVYNQTDFMRNQDLGFDKEQMLVIETDRTDKAELFVQKISGNSKIQSISTASAVPGGGGDESEALSTIVNAQGQEQTMTLTRYTVNEDYINQLGMKVIAGRNFSKQFATDSTNAMIINEKTVNLLGFATPQEAIGTRFDQWGRQGSIVGVIADFHLDSLQEEIAPLSFVYQDEANVLVNIKIASADVASILPFIESTFKEVFSDKYFDYFFLDESFDEQYREEDQFAQLFLNFAILAIFISCLGLLGLASYSTLQRKREIGIRKVLGASAAGIVNLISINFLKLVGIAILISVPISWYIMNEWLSDFAYRIDISIWVFVVAGLLAMTIAVITVAGQAIKAAVANPVDSIKTD